MKFTESDKISDPRFAAIQNDPRFIRPRRKQTKVQLDSRFRHLLDSKEFEFVQKVDKYGRPAQLSRERVDLKKFYRADNEDTEERKNISDIQVEEESDREKTGSESESSDGEEGFMDFARGKIAVSSSSDEDQGKSDEDDDAKLNKGSVADSQSGSNDDYQVGSDESEEEEDVIPLSGGRGDDGADGEGEEEVDAGIILQKEASSFY
jgi:hypothetical protein